MKRVLLTTLTTGSRMATFCQCIESLQQQKINDTLSVDILVVENNKTHNQAVVEAIARYQHAPFTIHHQLETTAGIPFARNNGLRFGQQQGFDYLAFVDDDAIADPNWILTLFSALQDHNVQVTTGPQFPIYPDNTETLYTAAKVYHERKLTDGTTLSWAATNNVLLDLNFFAQNQLVFNNQLIFGGEDKALFQQVSRHDGKILWVQNAIISEFISPERLSLKWALKRRFRIGATELQIESCINSQAKSYVRCLFKGSAYLAKGALLLLPDAILPKRSILNSLGDLAHGCGFFYGLFANVKSYT
ncbi:glycosyltransferase [Photobacterium angustum]|uniref:Glycosyl transferase family 2 n=1 Tax=Photobacterium angustum TaxID=661 RepID=A0A2S7W1X4_PHOAN|nr:glycosyltransferase [Photobacterium angustum]PQJ68003.1 glycosyl transferase family 2 [Photobacterium angustum]